MFLCPRLCVCGWRVVPAMRDRVSACGWLSHCCDSTYYPGPDNAVTWCMHAGDSPYTCTHSQPTDSGVESWYRVVRVQNHIISKPPALNVRWPAAQRGYPASFIKTMTWILAPVGFIVIVRISLRMRNPDAVTKDLIVQLNDGSRAVWLEPLKKSDYSFWRYGFRRLISAERFKKFCTRVVIKMSRAIYLHSHPHSILVSDNSNRIP